VTIEILVLALASTIRPTSLAAIYALLAHDSRRTLLCAYVAAGLVFTVGFGLIVVYAFHGIHVSSGTDRAKGIAEIAGGVLALLFAVAILTGRARAWQAQDAPDVGGRWKAMLSERVTTRTAVLAGPATHIPGLFYLIALNVIVAHHLSVAEETLAVATYNGIWFVLPILALVMCLRNPAAARDAVGSVEQWARAHSRTIVLCVSLIVGAALIVRGVLTL
jgi:hypothetical protein